MKKLLVITLLTHSIFTGAMQQDLVEIVEYDPETKQQKLVRITEDKFLNNKQIRMILGLLNAIVRERILELQRIFNVQR